MYLHKVHNSWFRRQDEMVIRILESLNSSDLMVIPSTEEPSLELLFCPINFINNEKISDLERSQMKKYLGFVDPELKTRCIFTLLDQLQRRRPFVFKEVVGISFKGILGKTEKIFYTKNFRLLVHAMKLANAIFQGILTFSGKLPFHDSAIHKKGKIISRDVRNSYPLLRLTIHYLRHFPKVEEKILIKRIKLSLTGKFAKMANQELPEGFPELAFPILPPIIEKYLLEGKKRSKILQLFFSLQQCKGLCESVPISFLKDGLIKHKKGIVQDLETLLPRDDQMAERLRQYSSQKYGKIIKDLYDPFTTKLPTSSACIENSREKGGALAHLLKEKKLQISSNSYVCSEFDRVEPLVIGLFGSPGNGKTVLINTLVNFFHKKYFRSIKSKSDLTYTRSCNVAFWDKYSHQPIVIMDDFGQNLESRADIIEFDQLISCNPYYLPMAELREKGTMFNSPIVIITSNLAFGSPLSFTTNVPILDSFSFWRRFSFACSLTRKTDQYGKRISYRHLNLLSTSVDERYQDLDKRDETMSQYGRLETFVSVNRIPLKIEILEETNSFKEFLPKIGNLYIKRLEYHHSEILGYWHQKIVSLDLQCTKVSDELEMHVECNDTPFYEGCHLDIKFPLFPPTDELPHVQGVPLAEPLKVRVITKGHTDTRCLKPLQMAMWKSLTFFPEFNLTHGCKKENGKNKEQSYKASIEMMELEIQRISKNPGLWISGDYDAATDNLPMWVTQALMEGILEHIDHEPTKAWARYETGPHKISYPKSYNLEGGIQTSGQLMGSLLSFPLLCMANDFLCSVLSNFSPGSYLINGDDIVGKESQVNIDLWKKHSASIGLSLSVGKNFVDQDFCTVNSQLFYNEKRLDTGKVELIYRGDKTVGECWREFQKYYGTNEIFFQHFIRNNFHRLKQSPSSLWVPVSHGGLGEYFTHSPDVNQKLAKKVYFTQLFKKLYKDRSKTLNVLSSNSTDILSIPCHKDKVNFDIIKGNESNKNIITKLDSFIIPENTIKEQKFLSHKDVRNFENKILPSYNGIKTIIENSKIYIHHLPSLENFITIDKFIPTLIKEELNIFHSKKFFNNFSQYLVEDFSPLQSIDVKYLLGLSLEDNILLEKAVEDRRSWIKYIDEERGTPPNAYETLDNEQEQEIEESTNFMNNEDEFFKESFSQVHPYLERLIFSKYSELDIKHSEFELSLLYSNNTDLVDLTKEGEIRDNIFKTYL